MDVMSNQKNLFSTSVRRSEFDFPFTIAVGFLIFNTVSAIVRLRRDILAVSFIVSFFVFIMILFWILALLEKLPQDSKEKERLKPPMWAVATSHNLMFAYWVCTLFQPGIVLGGLVWGMAVATGGITFYFFFVYGKRKSKKRKVIHRIAGGCLRIASSIRHWTHV